LTTSTTRPHIQENFEISALPEDALREIKDNIKMRIRFNSVVGTGVPGFIPRSKWPVLGLPHNRVSANSNWSAPVPGRSKLETTGPSEMIENFHYAGIAAAEDGRATYFEYTP
jgi:hypothetical protein